MNGFLLPDKLILLAHRGGGGEAPENSLAAFQKAADAGYQHLETDVHLGTDGKLYLHHGRFTLFPDRLLAPDTSFTTLETLFQTFPDKFISIDPKHEPAAEPLARLIAKYSMADNVCVVSPGDDSRSERVAAMVERLCGTRPSTALSSLRSTIDILSSDRRLRRDARAIEATMIDVHKRLISPRVIARAHRCGLKIIAWTVNDEATMRRFIARGVDGFMTDLPSVAKDFLN